MVRNTDGFLDFADSILNRYSMYIDTLSFDVLYSELYDEAIDIDRLDYVGQFTELLIENNLDPLQYLNYVPYGYLWGGNLKSFTIPDGVFDIYQGAFSGSDIKSITLGKDVKRISDRSFCDSRLEEINLNEGLKVIGVSAFNNCELKHVEIPASVVEIQSGAFSSCLDLTDVTIYGRPVASDHIFAGSNIKHIKVKRGAVLNDEQSVRDAYDLDSNVQVEFI